MLPELGELVPQLCDTVINSLWVRQWCAGDKFPEWKNNIFVGGLASQALVRLELENGRVTKEERYLHDLGERIRDVQQGPDGYIYVITNNSNGRILRVVVGNETSARDVPRSLADAGHTVLAVEVAGPGLWRITVRKGSDRRPA